jgi:hypothetical protein
MGNNNSSNSSTIKYNQQIDTLQSRALELFRHRVNNYHYAYHGPYEEYIHYIRAQYELDCFPESLRYGPNYNRNNR